MDKAPANPNLLPIPRTRGWVDSPRLPFSSSCGDKREADVDVKLVYMLLKCEIIPQTEKSVVVKRSFRSEPLALTFNQPPPRPGGLL